MTETFLKFNLHSQLVQALVDLDYRIPTPIQSAVIPAMIAGHDVIGQSQTGTGKTAAFSLPMLHALSTERMHVQGLVVTPTRELALQVAEAITRYGRHRGVRVLPVYGGRDYSSQLKGLRKGAHIVVGTPGRLIDLIQKGALDLGGVSTVVLDEADEMLSMGFIEDIATILDKTPPARQTALFSATMPAGILRLVDRYLKNPQSCAVGRAHTTVDGVEQRHYVVNENDKLAALSRLLEMEDITRALVFARTRIGTAELVNELTVRGFLSDALNGDMSQDAREGVLGRFRHNKIKILVATDVAARGLDIDDISHVINYDLPHDPEVYVHRTGRTARAGKAGIAISLATPKEVWFMRKVEGFIHQRITRATLPTEADIEGQREAQLLEKVKVWLKRDRCRRERKIAADLAIEGYDPLEIAAAAMRMARAGDAQRPIEPIGAVEELKPRKTKRFEKGKSQNTQNGRAGKDEPAYKRSDGREAVHERGMVRLVLKSGKADGIHAGAVVDTLSHNSKIPGRSIGKISIQNRCTYVDIPERFVGQVLAGAGKYRIGAQPIAIERI